MRIDAKHMCVTMLGACLAVLLNGLFVSAQQGGNGYLKLKVHPGSAGVFVDGNYMGPAANFGIARKYAVAVGEHEIILKDSRYEDYSTKVNIEAGKTTTLSQSLQPVTPPSPPFGTLRIKGGSSKFDGVFLNGKFMGHLDEFNNFAQGMLITPGEYTLTVVSPGGKQELEEKIQIEEKKTTLIRVR
jgi:hypothetical protein